VGITRRSLRLVPSGLLCLAFDARKDCFGKQVCGKVAKDRTAKA